VKEPKRDEDTAVAPPATEQEISQPQEIATEPRAYAFDGWAMVPLELDTA
jgi:hypothetical protein